MCVCANKKKSLIILCSLSFLINHKMTDKIEDQVDIIKKASNQTSLLAWIELIAVILLNLSINLRWLTFSPVATIASQYLDVKMSSITWLANCATLIYIGISASTGWVFEKYGMKACVRYIEL